MDEQARNPGSMNDNGDNAAALADKPRLTEQEKKNNHIASEQKRRQAIREGFDDIADIVPGMKGHGRSEAMVLEGATAYVKTLLAERYRLLVQAKRRGLDSKPWLLDEKTMDIAKKAAEEEEEEQGRADDEKTEPEWNT